VKGCTLLKTELSSLVYKGIRGAVDFFYPQMELEGSGNIPEGPALIVGNHAQMHGPIALELSYPKAHAIWCAGEMMDRSEVADYAYRDFWSQKPQNLRWFYRLLSHLIVPLSVCIFNNADTIGVYHDTRLLSTYRKSVEKLESGCHLIIFPEHDRAYNSVLCDFQDRFVDTAKLFYGKTKISLPFVPMYVAPALKKICFGEAVYYQPDTPIREERERICKKLKEEITSMALRLPKHRIVPYNNISKKQYPFNTL